MRIVVTATHPWDTDAGGILAPGERADVEDSARVQDALAAGLIREDDSPPAPDPSVSPHVQPATARVKPRTATAPVDKEGAGL